VFEISGETGVDSRDFVEQHVVELNLRSEQNRRCRRAGQSRLLFCCADLSVDVAGQDASSGVSGRRHNSSFALSSQQVARAWSDFLDLTAEFIQFHIRQARNPRTGLTADLETASRANRRFQI
jgi:hypothetical protein